MKMDKLIEVLQEIDNDFYRGFYTVGERYDLIKAITEILRKQQFI